MRSNRRSGFTLAELMIAATLMLLVFAMVVPLLRMQTQSLGGGAGRLDALQTARFAQNAIDRDLRIAGDGVLSQRPMVVQAGPMAVTFNVNLTTRDSTDENAVYYDPHVDTMTSQALPMARAITLPLSANVYPAMDYVTDSGVIGPAETISYWLSLDSTSAQPNIYILWRRANDAAPKVVSRGISVSPGTAFFQYYKKNQSTGTLDSIPNASLPLFHSVPQHGSVADTGIAALIDSVRMVRMSVTGLYVDPQAGPVYRSVTTSTKLLNAGLLSHVSCGDAPLPVPSAPVATVYGSVDSLTLTWTASPDQDGGMRSVEQYLVYRRPVGAPTWGDPATSFPAGQPSYDWNDPAWASMHGLWEYAVIAQDCTPTNSSLISSNQVTLP
jgi:type II secretory pathway pseudopilin PulG